MNRGELRTRVARTLGVAASGTSDDDLAEADELNDLANEAVIDILSRTRVHVRQVNLALDEGDAEYDVDPAILKMRSLKRGTSFLVQVNEDELSSGTYAVVGFNRIVLGMPAVAEEILVARYTPLPTPMTLDTHDPAVQAYGRIPVEFHPAIVNYMCWHMADKAGDQGSQRGERYRILYEGQDRMAGVGTDLGRIKMATNTRVSAVRIRRAREVLSSEIDVNPWTG